MASRTVKTAAAAPIPRDNVNAVGIQKPGRRTSRRNAVPASWTRAAQPIALDIGIPLGRGDLRVQECSVQKGCQDPGPDATEVQRIFVGRKIGSRSRRQRRGLSLKFYLRVSTRGRKEVDRVCAP